MTPTEMAWLEQGSRVAIAVAWTDIETRTRMMRYMTWRWGFGAVAALAVRQMGWLKV